MPFERWEGSFNSLRLITLCDRIVHHGLAGLVLGLVIAELDEGEAPGLAILVHRDVLIHKVSFSHL